MIKKKNVTTNNTRYGQQTKQNKQSLRQAENVATQNHYDTNKEKNRNFVVAEGFAVTRPLAATRIFVLPTKSLVVPRSLAAVLSGDPLRR